MNPLLPLLLVLSLAGLAWRRREGGRAWVVAGLAATALLAPALALPDGIPSPSATLARLAPWQAAAGGLAADRRLGNPDLVDVTFQVEPWLLFLRSELRAGRWPLWDPYQSSGAPYWSNGSSAPLFPLHLLFALLPLQAGFVLLPWLRLVLGGLGAFRLGRQLGVGREAALLAALVYPLSGRFASFLLFPMGNALALVPWVLLAVERIAAGRRGWRLLALAGGLQLLAGHPETAVMTALASALYLLVRGVGPIREVAPTVGAGEGPREPARAADGGPSRRWLAAWGGFAGGWAAAGAIAAVQLLPLAFTLLASNRWQEWRPGEPNSLSRIGSLLLRFVLPDAFGHAARGDYWGPLPFVPTTVYAGALTLPLVAAGLWAARHDRRWRALAVTALVCLAASYHLPGVRELLLAIPVLQKALHHYLLPVVELALALLAAAGLERFRRGEGRGLLAGVAAVALALGAGWWAFGGEWAARGQTVREAAWTAAILALAAGLGLALLLAPANRRRLVPALLVLTAADLVIAHAPSNPGLPLARLYPETGAVAFLAGRPERLAAPGNVLRPNAAMVYGLYDVRGDDSLKLRPYEDLYAAHLGAGHPTFFRPLTAWRSPWLDRLGVRWVVTDPGAPPLASGWHEAYAGPDATVYERPHPQPLVRFAEPAPPAAAVAVEAREPGRWRLRWQTPAAATLVVAETWDRGWRAEVDGREVPVARVEEALMGVRLGPGAGRLALSYLPQGLGWGAVLTLLGLASLLPFRRLAARLPPHRHRALPPSEIQPGA
jgi:Bacterial membrane protein YfhO